MKATAGPDRNASSSTSLLDQIRQWGVVGAGGGGFPAHVKLNASADTIILNAAECEPLLHKDKELLRHYSTQIIYGFEQVRHLVRATDAVIGIKHKYTDVIELLQPQLHPRMRIAELTDTYPAGDEFVLVYDVTGRIIQPGRLPLSVGCIVINVETVLNIASARPVTRKFLTIAGAVRNPCTIVVPIGLSFAQAIELAGGATVPNPVALVGGAMMGSYTGDLSRPITKTTGGLIVLPRDHRLAERYRLPWQAIKTIGASACDQCTFCTAFCPRYLLGHPVEPHKAMRSLGFNLVGEANIIGDLFCCECNLCTMMACPEDLDPKNVVVHGKRELNRAGARWEVSAEPDRAEMHLDNRRVPIPRLIQKLGLHQFENKGPLIETPCVVRRVVLPLKQHAGAPATACVAVGDRVKIGDLLARPRADQLGANLHASIDGRITSIDESITIEA